MPNRAIEIHDSELVSLVVDAGHVILDFSPAYIHQTEGRPGVDAGTGWTQHAVIRIRGQVASGALTKLPCGLVDGYLELDGQEFDNVIPIPLSFTGDVELAITSEFDEAIKIRGNHIALGLLHGPEFVEKFPGAQQP
ncbi:MAG TPA: hypothetical protein VNZ47_13095 [Candidatus Dormibacteraeota bacterium]|nr:hypothetical protein [Candidatus Dormibacteraeota bacterium]